MECRIDNAPYGYLVLTKQGIIKETNKTFLKMIDEEQDNLINKNIEVILSPASKLIFYTLFFLQVQLNGRVDEVNLTIKSKMGFDVNIMLMGYIFNSDGVELIECIAIKMDKRHDYENELRSIKEELVKAYQNKDKALKKESELRTLLETTLTSIKEGIIVTDSSGKIILMNPMSELLTGWNTNDAYGRDFEEVFNLINITTRQKYLNLRNESFEKGISIDFSYNIALISKNNQEIFITGNAEVMPTEKGEKTGVVFAFKDITKEYFLEQEIDAFLNVNLEILCVADTNGNFHKVNKKFEEVLGYKNEELVGNNFFKFVHEDDIQDTLQILEELKNKDNKVISGFINRYRKKDGSYSFLEWHSQSGLGNFIYASVRDATEIKMREISERKKTEELKYISYHDQLTGLHNRYFFNNVISEEIIRADRYEHSISICILDLDHFKNVNDTWGHLVGDELLKHTAQILIQNIRSSDLLIRYGGEEFVIVMPGTSLYGALESLEKIRYIIENSNHPITGKQTVSVGVAELKRSESFEKWYERADEALYRAKKEGRNRVVVAIS